MKKKLVILGTDHGHWHAVVNGARSRKDIQLMAIAQETPPYADEPAADCGVKCYRSYLECLDREKPDIVGVAMHHGARAQWIAEALNRKMTVIADKPLCITESDLESIQKAHAVSPAPLVLMLTERCNPSYEAIRKVLKEGAVGDVVAVEATRYYALNRPSRPAWMFDHRTYAGLVLDIIIHDYDLARWITGVEWARAASREERSGRYEDRDFKDVAVLSSVEQGKPLSLMALWHSPQQHFSRFTVYGTKGYVDLPLGEKEPVLVDEDGNRRKVPLADGPPFIERVFSALLDSQGELPISGEATLSLTESLIRSLRRDNGGIVTAESIASESSLMREQN